MINVILAGAAEELCELKIDPSPSVGDELILEGEPYLVTGRRFVLRNTQQTMKNLDYIILYVRKNW